LGIDESPRAFSGNAEKARDLLKPKSGHSILSGLSRLRVIADAFYGLPRTAAQPKSGL